MSAAKARPSRRSVSVPKAERISSHEVEEAIEKKLASMRTDVFGNDDTLIIVVEQEDY